MNRFNKQIQYLAHMLDECFLYESQKILGVGIKTNQILYRGQYLDIKIQPNHCNYYFCSTYFDTSCLYARKTIHLYKTDDCMVIANMRDINTFLKIGYPLPAAQYIVETEQNLPAIMLEAEGSFRMNASDEDKFEELTFDGGFDFSKWNEFEKSQFISWINDIILRCDKRGRNYDPLSLVIDDIVDNDNRINTLQDPSLGDVILIDSSIMPKISTGIVLTADELQIFKDRYRHVIDSGDADEIIKAAKSVMGQT